MRRKGEAVDINRHRPARTPEEQEAYMINLAERAAEKQLLEGTASSQVICHYLKLGSSREKLENEALRKKMELDNAKIDSLHSSGEIKTLFNDAMNALKGYRGEEDDSEDPNLQ